MEFIQKFETIIDYKFDKFCEKAYDEHLEFLRLQWIKRFKEELLGLSLHFGTIIEYRKNKNKIMDTLSKERMLKWAEELKMLYFTADSNFELMDCADAMADFIDEFLKIKW